MEDETLNPCLLIDFCISTYSFCLDVFFFFYTVLRAWDQNREKITQTARAFTRTHTGRYFIFCSLTRPHKDLADYKEATF